MSNILDETQFSSIIQNENVRQRSELGSRRGSDLLNSGSRTSLQKSSSKSGQSLLSARLTDTNGLLLVNDRGIAKSANGNNSVSRIAQDLINLEKNRRPSTQSLRSQFISNQKASQLNLNSNFLSNIEASILRSENPIQLDSAEEIEVNGERGFWANKNEVINWRGEIPINEYLINQDSSPEIINKRSLQQLEYIQELAIRYLRPPTPPSPGEILINQLPNVLTPPAPPLVIRQQPPRPVTPEPLIIREAPPQPPAQIGRKIITISGKRIPPPPRKVVIERLAPLPPKPQAVIVERWLPYAEVKRRVIFQKPTEADPIVIKPKNVIIQWSAPQVNVKREYKYLGVIRANPREYVERYGNELKKSNELPQFVLDIKTPEGIVLAAEKKYNRVYELEGDVEALNLINLENEGLGEYRNYLQQYGIGTRKNSLPRSQSTVFIPSNNFTSQRNSPEKDLSVGSRKPSLQNFSIPITSSQIFSNPSPKSPRSRLSPPNNLSIPVSNSGVFQSASFASQRSLSIRPISRNQSIQFDEIPAKTSINSPRIVPDSPKLTQRSILKSSSTILQPSTYSSSSKRNQPSFETGASNLNYSFSSGSINKPSQTLNSSSNISISGLIEKIFKSIDKNNKGIITVEDAEKILLRLNSRLGRRYGEDDVKALFATLDINNDGQIDLEEFKRAFLNIAN